jgi:hypothetical protein
MVERRSIGHSVLVVTVIQVGPVWPGSDRFGPAGDRQLGRRIPIAITTTIPTPISTSPTLNTLDNGTPAGTA